MRTSRARTRAVRRAAILTIAAVLCSAIGGTAQSRWAPPRTPDGHPDLQGIWVNNSATPLERPPAYADKPRLTDGEVAELKKRAARIFADGSDFAIGDIFFQALLANPDVYRNPDAVVGIEWLESLDIEHRTSLIVDPPDGRLPPLTTAARERQAVTAGRQRARRSAADLSNVLRCITAGAVRVGGNAAGFNSYFQIVQTRDHVVILAEMMHQARVIPLGARPPLPAAIRQWDGESRGRWNGDSLVVETSNFSATGAVRGATARLRVTERFTRTAHDTITQSVTFDDPDTWTHPWTAEIRLRRAQGHLYEIACHEGNARTIEGMLNAARHDEKLIGPWW